MKIFLMILGSLILISTTLMVVALCFLSSMLSREEERKEFLDYEINKEDV